MKIIPGHQFGFRDKHGTIDQVHQRVNRINKNLNVLQSSLTYDDKVLHV